MLRLLSGSLYDSCIYEITFAKNDVFSIKLIKNIIEYFIQKTCIDKTFLKPPYRSKIRYLSIKTYTSENAENLACLSGHLQKPDRSNYTNTGVPGISNRLL